MAACRLRKIGLLLLWFAFVALLNYEVVHKAPLTGLGPLPGSTTAARADKKVRYLAHTGLDPLDRLLHEGQEACVFYRELLAGAKGRDR